ncbi:MAG: hypothetical protein AB7U20_24000 [Planctomycetaceae bacterium]
MTLVLFPNSTHEPDSADAEDRIARLSDAAYQVALQHGFAGSFVEVQLGIWSAIRRVFEAEPVSDQDHVQDRRAHRRVPARIAGIG